ncbi:hypothetical protein GTA08_BOTSDO03935 [Neofusicoccum parvum]|uniref:Uncharacterized protein n=1 Tax=Neofusicoccum parvum TaxID=310453 RepID=A0ACB5SIQ7_9PEZI|nr:hypothetical protein GTA08_BOTSDO03935 [Neofusicoccum parvum]GME66278.1 hypothetical protein GTA08_BOTSDO03935 [Neofusicoccum parvum]
MLSPRPQPFRNPPSRIVQFRRKCFFGLLSFCVFVNGILSPAMAGLIAHILAVTHDQVPDYGGDLKRGSSYVIIATGALGLIDACVLFVMTLFRDDIQLKWNWSGKKVRRSLVFSFPVSDNTLTQPCFAPQNQPNKLPIHRISAFVAVVAVLRGIAAVVYSTYDWWESDQSIEQNLRENGTFYTPETWVCRGAPNQTTIEGDHPEYKWMCREAQGARYLAILVTVISVITLVLVLWRWRRRNMDNYHLVRGGNGGSQDPLAAAERGRGSVQEAQHMRLRSSSSPGPPQELTGREIHELPANPIHEMEHRPVIRDSDELSIQEEWTEYFGNAREHDRQHRRGSFEAT